MLLPRERVICRVDADGLKYLGVFGEAVLLESRGRHLPAVEVPVGRVKLAQPAFVLPRRGADEYTFGGEARQIVPGLLPVKKAHGVELGLRSRRVEDSSELNLGDLPLSRWLSFIPH